MQSLDLMIRFALRVKQYRPQFAPPIHGVSRGSVGVVPLNLIQILHCGRTPSNS